MLEHIGWLAGGIAHTLLHPDSSFLTLKEGGYGQFSAVALILLSNSIAIGALYLLTKAGVSCSINRSKRWSTRFHRWSQGVVGKYGYAGLVVLCLVPLIPCAREAALLSGQLLDLRYTLPVVVFSNSLRVMFLSVLYY